MSDSAAVSKLLALWEATSSPDTPPSDSFADISDELHTQLHQYALSTLDSNGQFTEDDENELVKGLTQEPRGILLLRALLRDAAAVEDLGPVPDSIINQQRNRLLGLPQQKATDFMVALSKSGLRYTGERPQRIATSFEMARDPNEPKTLLQHTQRLNHCEIKVSIETGSRQTFSIVLDFTYLDPQYVGQPLQVSMSDDGATVQQTQTVSTKSVEFGNLPGGSYTVDIIAAQTTIDQFRAELRLDDQP